MNDATTAALAFALTFLGLALYTWRLDARGRRLERRLEILEAATKGKKGDGNGGPQGTRAA